MNKVYETICPGCNFGCGLYIRENNGLEIDFRKSSQANSGKLCRFGMSLPRLYKPFKSRIDGKEVSIDEAKKEALNRIKDKNSVGFLSFGNATNEEFIEFQKLINNGNFYSGVEINAFPNDVYNTLSVGIPYDEVETSKHIVLFIDPYEQYPLIVRRLLLAKKNGAKLTSIWWKDMPLADENIRPSEFSKLKLTKDSLVIADFHPFSDIETTKNILSLVKTESSKVMFLKPFANSSGQYLLSKEIKQKSLKTLIEDIESGKIKTLFCLESDISEFIPEKTLTKLSNIVVQSGKDIKIANIMIENEPFYKKNGTFVNNEGRVQKLLDGKIIEEFNIPKYERGVYSDIKGSFKTVETNTSLISVYNPFMWNRLSDDNDFIEISLNTALKLKLLKGGTIKIRSNGNLIEKKFRIAQVQDNILLSGKRFGIEKGLVTNIEVG